MTAPLEEALVDARLDDWRGRLIDLSHRNRLIAFRPTRATTLSIAAPSIRELLADPERAQPWDFYFPPPPEDDADVEASDTASEVDRIVLAAQRPAHRRRANEIEVTERNPARIARVLDNLAKRSATEFQDKAIRILYIAAGFLDWHDDQRGKDIASPLVLVPVELRRESTRHPYRLWFVPDEDIVLNPSLTEKLSREAGFESPEDWAWEDKPVAQELEEVRRAVASNGWRVREDAVIGLFSFQKYVMYRDLLDHADRVVAHPIVCALAQKRRLEQTGAAAVLEPEHLDDLQPPGETLSILDADASQRVCVEAAKRGQSFVMQGPPGTGKSQTIANVIAEGIGQGKRILFVSEKAAALDVVYNRLAASGLDEYCLMLHGERAGRREVVEALDRSLTSALQPHHAMRGDELERLGHLRTLLNQTAELLHAPQALLGGRSLREVHEQLATLHDAPSVPGVPEADTLQGAAVLDEYQTLHEVFQRLAERWDVSPAEFAWRGYADARYTADDRGRLLVLLQALDRARGGLAALAAHSAEELGLPAPASLAAAERLADVLAHLERAPSLEPHWLDLDAAVLRAAAEAGRLAHEQAARARAAVGSRYPARALTDLAPDVGPQLLAARDAVRRACGWTAAWDSALAGLPGAAAALEHLPALIADARACAADCAHRLGQPVRDLGERGLLELAELAELAFSADERPEATWLVPAGHEAVAAALRDVESDLEAYQTVWAALGQNYAAGALELEAEAFRERFAERYTSLFARLSGAYRADARAIKAQRHDGKLPDSVVDDLARIAEARRLGARIDAAEPRLRQTLGARSAGRDTGVAATRAALAVAERVLALADPAADLDALAAAVAAGAAPQPALAQAAARLRAATRAALAVAERVLALADPAADLDALAAAVAAGSTPQPAIAQAAARLRAALTAVRGAVDAVQPFVEFPRQLFDDSLAALEARLAALAPAFGRLAALVADLDVGADTRATGFADSAQRAAAVTAAHTADRRLADSSPRWEELIGPRFAGADTPWGDVVAAADWLLIFTELGGELTASVRERLLGSPPYSRSASRLAEACAGARGAGDAVAALFEPDRRAELAELLQDAAYADVAALTARLSDHVDELHDWTQWRAWRARAARAGWDGFVVALVAADVSDDQVVPAFARAYWNRRLEALYDDDPDLADDLRGGAFGAWVEEFRTRDRKLVATGADRLIAQRERSRRRHVSTPGSEIDLLRREARKQRRHLPVRTLLARIPTLLSELKPCLMMSPLTVSHFLSPDHRFDMVVFDEASQVPPQDAVNCIYRGDQLVVAGDSKQLPPTTFFQTAELDERSVSEEEAETTEDMESVLDACEALLPQHALRWHYRSRDERLIGFSNRHIYADRLVTFPSAEPRSARLGIGFIHVPDGVYDRGRSACNRREAQVAAQRVVQLLRAGGRSLGVIAFNSTQAAAIAEELDLLRAQDPGLEPLFAGDRLDAVFVKHLEAVQGDERDVIVFSVGYGRDAAGTFTMNFGPLNKEGGQRRLNVAVTRARERVEVVSSVRAADFRLSPTSSLGARLLRDYIAYAETGGRLTADLDSTDVVRDGDVAGPIPEPAWASPLEEQVGLVIEQLGYEAVPSVGEGSLRIDVGVRARPAGDRYLLGIECDGAGYARTPTARDRERLRHAVLAELGWGPIHRIWSLDWVRNRAGEIERLRVALEAAAERAAARTPTPPPPVLVERPRERIERELPELGASTAAVQLRWTRIYRRARLGTPTRFYEFHETVNRREQTDMLVELVAVEAPISIDYAIRRIAKAWGIDRAGHRVVSAGRQAISQASRRGALKVRGEFLWKPDQVLTYVRIPDPDRPDDRREIEEIPPEEIALAMARLREDSPGIDDEQLIVQVARIFGFDRVGGRIRAVLDAQLAAQAERP